MGLLMVFKKVQTFFKKIVLLLFIFALLALTSCGEKMSLLFDTFSPDGKFKITAYYILPQNALAVRGYSTIVVFANDKELFRENLSNDGATPNEANYLLEWKEKTAKLVLKGYEQGDKSYSIDFSRENITYIELWDQKN